MKDASNVGGDFDKFAKNWKASEFGLEVGGDVDGIKTVASDEVKRAGDEWGAQQKLLEMYAPLFDRYISGDSDVNFLEIGPGGGRSSECVIQLLDSRLKDYQAIDVSAEYAKVAQDRVGERVKFNIISEVNLQKLPKEHFDFCLAQSSWSHINFYDQYRYLRELRPILKKGAAVAVIGQFVQGVGDDWSWNRFLNRVEKQESGKEGIYHEFIGVSALAEILTRLGYTIDVIFRNGFVARNGGEVAENRPLTGSVSFPYAETLGGLFQGKTRMEEMPFSSK